MDLFYGTLTFNEDLTIESLKLLNSILAFNVNVTNNFVYKNTYTFKVIDLKIDEDYSKLTWNGNKTTLESLVDQIAFIVENMDDDYPLFSVSGEIYEYDSSSPRRIRIVEQNPTIETPELTNELEDKFYRLQSAIERKTVELASLKGSYNSGLRDAYNFFKEEMEQIVIDLTPIEEPPVDPKK